MIISIEALLAAFQDQIDKIDQAIIDVRQDKAVDMSHLDAEVFPLCRQAERVHDEDKHLLAQPMAEIIGRLETLAIELQEYKARFQNKTTH